MNAAPEEALPLLIDLAQNFPIRARQFISQLPIFFFILLQVIGPN
jgi:hypothetical protein